MSGRAVAVALCLAALAVYLAASSIYIVNEGEQALVVRLGAPVGVVDKPGLRIQGARSSTASTSRRPARSCSSRRSSR